VRQEAKEQVNNRLKRIEGQIKGIQRMVEEEKAEPKQVLIQLSAVIASLENTKISLVEEYTREKILASIDTLSDLLK
jgi:DNA-binding FrmR family transcriptional regulator